MTLVILGALFPTQFVRREVSPPIIRDRAGAIRPDFSVCVECRANWQTDIACYSCVLVAPGKRKGVGGPLRLPGYAVRGNLRRCSLSIVKRVVRPIGSHRTLSCLCKYLLILSEHMTCYSSFLVAFGERKGSGGPLFRLLGRAVRGNLKWWTSPY